MVSDVFYNSFKLRFSFYVARKNAEMSKLIGDESAL